MLTIFDLMQIEQSVKLCRFLACTAAGAAASAAGSSGSAAAEAAAAPVLEALKVQLKGEVDAAVGFILENLAALTLLEDRAVALAEAAQVRVTWVEPIMGLFKTATLPWLRAMR